MKVGTFCTETKFFWNILYLFDLDQFSTILRRAIEDKGLSQSQAAKLIGIQPRALNNYINGTREPDLETLKQIILKLDLGEKISSFLLVQSVPHETKTAASEAQPGYSAGPGQDYAAQLIAVLKEQNEFLRRNFEVSLNSIHQISVAQLVHLKALEWYHADQASKGDPEKTQQELMRMGSKIAELAGVGSAKDNPVGT